MIVKDVIKKLEGMNPKARIIFSTDEEGNSFCENIEVEYLHATGDLVGVFPLDPKLSEDLDI